MRYILSEMVDGLYNRNKRTHKMLSALAAAILAIKFTLNEAKSIAITGLLWLLAKSIIVSYINRDLCLKLNTKMLNIWQAHHSLFINGK